MSVCSPKSAERWNRVRYVGIDIGKWKCRAAIMNPDGVVVDEFTFPNDGEGILSLASRFTTEDRGVMESTGSVWSSLYNHLDGKQVPVVLANPLKTRAIASARIKTDKVDARIPGTSTEERPGGRVLRPAEGPKRDEGAGQAQGRPGPG